MYDSALQYVDFIDPRGNPVSGLVSVHDIDSINLNINEKAAVFDAATFRHIDYIFFRRFSDGRSSQIAAYVVDNSDERLSEEALAKLHHQVWLHGVSPLLYVAWPSRIDILSCARGPDFWENKGEALRYNPAKEFKIAGKINKELQRFSAFRLSDGTFWDEPVNHSLTAHDKAAHQSLIKAIVETDKALKGESNPVLRRLLLLMVLIKYLEDRRVFPDDFFEEYRKGAKSFFDVLRGGEPEEVYVLLDFLEQKFNGDIFKLERDVLTKSILDDFAYLVEAKTEKRQRYLWKQYTFEHLPVEVVSHLYQRFVQGGHGAVYTPPFLAAMLLDHAMPYNKLTGKERVLDPACGSGIFLVGAFRRLINIWRYKNNWQRPTVETLKDILHRSIFGTELDENAVDLTAFSLNLAVCDALMPDVIWNELQFDRLRESNLFEVDFFQELLDSRKGKVSILNDGFNVIVGNPPFMGKLTAAGKKVDREACRKEKTRGLVPRKEIAYLFFEQAFTIMREAGRLCLIQPSGLLYHQKANAFCSAILRRYRIKSIFDFTSIRHLYEADPKTIAVIADAIEPAKDNVIDHWTFRRTTSVSERICFELDHYDRHHISQNQAETDPYVWRINLLGGGRLYEMSKRFRQMPTLKKYVEQKGWSIGEGFIVGNHKHRSDFLHGKQFLPSDALTSLGIDMNMIETVSETHFEGPRQEILFEPPLLLIRELGSLPTAFWEKGILTYGNEIVGIHSPATDKQKLKKLYNLFSKQQAFFHFLVTLHGSRSKATAILKKDVENLPIPEELELPDLSFWEKAIQVDVIEYMSLYVRRGQNSTLLKAAADKRKMSQYADMFIKMLGSVYENLHAAEPIFLNGLICQPFYFGESPNLQWVAEQDEEALGKLIHDDKSYANLRTIRVVRYYCENVLLLVKPDRLRYWIPSTAIWDADETLTDLRKQGY